MAYGATITPTASFTRPSDTTQYASGDLVANSTTAASVRPMEFLIAPGYGSGMIRRATLRKTGTSVTNAAFRIHLYKASPGTITNGDNGAWSTSGVDDYLGAFDITVDRAFTDGAAGNGVPLSGPEVNYQLASTTTVYALLEARNSYTPASGEVFTLGLEVLQN